MEKEDINKKSVEEVKTSIENKVREEVETLLDSSIEEISGGFTDATGIEDEGKTCECGIAFAKA